MDQRRWVQRRLRQLSQARMLGRSVADAADTPQLAPPPPFLEPPPARSAAPVPQRPRSTDDTQDQPADPQRQPAH